MDDDYGVLTSAVMKVEPNPKWAGKSLYEALDEFDDSYEAWGDFNMDKKVILYNVRDTRTGKVHSVAVVSEKNAQYFVPVNEEQDGE